MNQRSSKKLRKLINPQDATSRKVYRRLKKSYSKLNCPKAKEDFIKAIENLQQTSNINI